MSANPTNLPTSGSFVVRIALWSIRHRRLAVGGWVLLFVVGLMLMKGVGNRFDNSLSLPGSNSQKAVKLLESRFSAQAGDADQIVFAVRSGRLTDPSVRSVVLPTLNRVARLPHVTGVSSPYAANGRPATISRDGRIGIATVRFDKQGDALPTAAIKKVVKTAEAARSSHLQVELNGNAIEQLQRPSLGPATGVGIAAAAVILLLSFGSFLAMGLPILTAAFGIGVGAGVIAAASQLLTIPDFAQQLALMISLGVGVDYALLVVTRFRDAYCDNGGDVRGAIETAMDTAGRSITFAGLTVVIALLGLYTVGVNLLYGVALAASASVLLVLAGSLTLLPAVLSLHGRIVGEGRRKPRRTRSGPGFAARWIAVVQRRPRLAAIGAVALLLALAAPALGLRLAIADAGNYKAKTTTRKAYDLVSRGFGKGANGPLLVAVGLPSGGDTPALTRIVSAVRSTADVATVEPPQLNAGRDTAAVTVIPASAPDSKTTYDLVKRLRSTVLPSATNGTAAKAYVGGFTATQADFTKQLSTKLPMFIGIVIALSALLLLVVFRSLLIPLQAAAMNLLSIGAALGIVQAIFERGWLAGPLGIQRAPIEPFLPVILFAVVFGLSMDYEVFLVSRIREEWRRTGDTTRAIRDGVSRTGRVITAAAAVMVVVFASFAGSGNHILQVFGIGLATAILLDAVVIRMVLLPAVLELFGRTTWKFPGHLDRHLPRVTVEPHAETLSAALALDPAG